MNYLGKGYKKIDLGKGLKHISSIYIRLCITKNKSLLYTSGEKCYES